MDLRVLFRVPEDAASVAEILGEHGVTEGLGGNTDGGEIADFLDVRAGEWAEAELDSDDPVGAACELASRLSDSRSPFWIAFDAFTEPSRGLRVLGRVYVSPAGDPVDPAGLEVPWTHGRPAMDERTLMAAGMTREEADAVCEAFFAPSPPRPGP